eukprot:IDg17402t1
MQRLAPPAHPPAQRHDVTALPHRLRAAWLLSAKADRIGEAGLAAETACAALH